MGPRAGSPEGKLEGSSAASISCTRDCCVRVGDAPSPDSAASIRYSAVRGGRRREVRDHRLRRGRGEKPKAAAKAALASGVPAAGTPGTPLVTPAAASAAASAWSERRVRGGDGERGRDGAGSERRHGERCRLAHPLEFRYVVPSLHGHLDRTGGWADVELYDPSLATAPTPRMSPVALATVTVPSPVSAAASVAGAGVATAGAAQTSGLVTSSATGWDRGDAGGNHLGRGRGR